MKDNTENHVVCNNSRSLCLFAASHPARHYTVSCSTGILCNSVSLTCRLLRGRSRLCESVTFATGSALRQRSLKVQRNESIKQMKCSCPLRRRERALQMPRSSDLSRERAVFDLSGGHMNIQLQWPGNTFIKSLDRRPRPDTSSFSNSKSCVKNLVNFLVTTSSSFLCRSLRGPACCQACSSRNPKKEIKSLL